MSGARCARHVEFAKSPLVFQEFPFGEETEGTHAEGEDGGN